ncbi:hypothetical protein BJ875DRAFT_46620 [Amylocarpus encephaloides]|uniref:Uncharacterized protein n=1 Tax=Amylocarpus encephaloides TaxID=45428 RepID=A0A9P7YRF1_9HELO|nr:hypothetical protein BJ875DRAFT_46620 [Amylocarpus encephaloides]
MQNLILQHSSIERFLKYYLDRNINVDVQNIYRGQSSQGDLMRFACSMSRSIDPRRPRKLTTAQSASVNRLPYILRLDRRISRLLRVQGRPGGEEKYQRAIRRLLSEKQRQRRIAAIKLGCGTKKILAWIFVGTWRSRHIRLFRGEERTQEIMNGLVQRPLTAPNSYRILRLDKLFWLRRIF